MTQRGDIRQQQGSVDGLIEEMKVATGAASDTELASVLGHQRSAVAQWRRRGKVSEKALSRVRLLRYANEDETKARALLARFPPDVLIYAKALAVVSTAAGFTEPCRDSSLLDTEADRLRREVLELDRATAAAAFLVATGVERGKTAWEAFKALLSYGFLRHDIREGMATNVAAMRWPLPQPDGDKPLPTQEPEPNGH